MRLPNDTQIVKIAADGQAEPVLNYETRANKDVLGRSLLLTVEEASVLLRLGRTSAYELVMRGTIPSVKIGRRRLVVRAGLEEYVARLALAQRQESDPSKTHILTIGERRS